jgi:hypothetical protein
MNNGITDTELSEIAYHGVKGVTESFSILVNEVKRYRDSWNKIVENHKRDRESMERWQVWAASAVEQLAVLGGQSVRDAEKARHLVREYELLCEVDRANSQ